MYTHNINVCYAELCLNNYGGWSVHLYALWNKSNTIIVFIYFILPYYYSWEIPLLKLMLTV